jgi:hypothetical protein
VAVVGDGVWQAGGTLLVEAGARVLRGGAGPALPAAWAAGLAAGICRSGDVARLDAVVAGISGATRATALEVWVDAWESLVSAERRRASCAALIRLVGAGCPEAVAQLPAIVCMVSEVAAEGAAAAHEAAARDRGGSVPSAVQLRRRALWSDCLEGAGPAAMLHRALESCRAQGGSAAVDAALAEADGTILAQL